MTSVTISTSALLAQADPVVAQASGTGARTEERSPFAEALNRVRGNDGESASGAAPAVKQNGTPQAASAQSRAQSPHIAPEKKWQGTTRPAKAQLKRAPDQPDDDARVNAPSSHVPNRSLAPSTQPAVLPLEAPVCLPQIPPGPDVTDEAADSRTPANIKVVTGECATEPQQTSTQSFFVMLPDPGGFPIPQTDVPVEASKPADPQLDRDFKDLLSSTPEDSNVSAAAAIHADRGGTLSTQNPVTSRPDNRPHGETTTTQQFTVTASDANRAPANPEQSTDTSAQPPTSAAAVLNVNVAAHAAVQAGLATTGTKGLHLDARSTVALHNVAQQPTSGASRPGQPTPQNPPAGAKPISVSGANASAPSEDNNDATPDSQHHALSHDSAPTIAVSPSTTPSSANPDVSTRPATHIEAAPKEAAVTDPAPVNSSAIAARAAEALRNADLHVGWRSDQLGRVDIHAQLRGHEVAAAMRVEDSSGRQWLSAELPQLIESLSRQDLRVTSLNVADFANHSASSQSGSQGGTPQQQRSPVGAHTTQHTAYIPPEELFATDSATPLRLSIHV